MKERNVGDSQKSTSSISERHKLHMAKISAQASLNRRFRKLEAQLDTGSIVRKSNDKAQAEMLEDVNYQAFLNDEAFLKRKFAGCIVAYADGKRVSIGRNADELLAGLEPKYETTPLFIKNISQQPIRFRRPMHMHRSK